MLPPFFSIIIPVYNGSDFLDKTIESVLGQSFQDVEIIAVDDGSTDQSLSVINRYAESDSRIRVFAHDTSHGGPFTARNTALSHATGNYLIFLDQDDLLIPESLVRMQAFIAESGSDLVRGIRISLKRGREKIMNEFLPDTPLKNVCFAHTRDEWAGQHFASWAFRREFIEHQQLTFKPYIGHDDKAFLLCALAKSEHISISNIPVVKYRRHGASLQGKRNLKEMLHDMQAHDDMMQCLHETGNHEILAYRFSRWDFRTIAGACAWAAMWGDTADRHSFYEKAKTILNRPEVRQLPLENSLYQTILSQLLESDEPTATRYLRQYSHRLKHYPPWRVLWNRAIAAFKKQS